MMPTRRRANGTRISFSSGRTTRLWRPPTTSRSSSASHPTSHPVGAAAICNVSYVLVGLMIEQATGSTYREYVSEHVFARAGMNRSGFFRMDVVEPDVAEAWRPSRTKAVVSLG